MNADTVAFAKLKPWFFSLMTYGCNSIGMRNQEFFIIIKRRKKYADVIATSAIILPRLGRRQHARTKQLAREPVSDFARERISVAAICRWHLNRNADRATKSFAIPHQAAQAAGQKEVPAPNPYLPFQLGVRLLRNASIPSRKSSLI